jgi:hypothetical protein
MLRRTRLSRLVVVATGLACLVSGCSQDAADPPRVATLQTQASPAPSAAQTRPVFPLDATDDDKKAMVRDWENCLVTTGGPQYRGQGEILIVKEGVIADDAKSKAVFKACEARQPETYEQHQQRTDLTEFKDNQREWYRCAKEAGYKLTAPDPETGEFGLTEVGPNGDANSPKMQECKRKAFGG